MPSGRRINGRKIRRGKTIRKLNEVSIFHLFPATQLPKLTIPFLLVAFAEIDWHDYAIVQTIEFTGADATSELPPPMSVQEVENMTLAQKRMAAMIMENTVEEVEAHRARQAEADAAAAAVAQTVGKVTVVDEADEDAAMEESDDEMIEDKRRKDEVDRQRELARAQALQPTSGPMKIRTDYVPKSMRFLFWFLIHINSFLFSWCKECQINDDHLFYLWSTNSRGRAPRTHAYRATRSQMERAA